MPADTHGYSTNGTSELKFSGTTLSADDQKLLYYWIAEGAQNN
jgi:hypothetical protein